MAALAATVWMMMTATAADSGDEPSGQPAPDATGGGRLDGNSDGAGAPVSQPVEKRRRRRSVPNRYIYQKNDKWSLEVDNHNLRRCASARLLFRADLLYPSKWPGAKCTHPHSCITRCTYGLNKLRIHSPQLDIQCLNNGRSVFHACIANRALKGSLVTPRCVLWTQGGRVHARPHAEHTPFGACRVRGACTMNCP